MKNTAGLPASEILPHWHGITYQSEKTARTATRALIESDHLPRSAGGNAQALFGPADVTMLLLGTCIASVEPIRNIPKLAPIYYSLRDENGYRVGDVIATCIESVKGTVQAFKNKDATTDTLRTIAALNTRFEIDVNFPRVRMVTEIGDGKTEEKVFGPVKDRQSTFTRVSNVAIVSGSVLFRLGIGLYFNKWDSDDVI